MYNSTILAERIKIRAKEQHIQLKTIWSSVGITDNTLVNLRKGSMLGADKLALIADYLNCSVDYLLGRTDSPEVTGGAYINGDNNNNGQQAINGNMTVNNTAAPNKDTLTEQFMQKFEQLDFDDKVDVMQYVKNKK